MVLTENQVESSLQFTPQSDIKSRSFVYYGVTINISIEISSVVSKTKFMDRDEYSITVSYKEFMKLFVILNLIIHGTFSDTVSTV